MVKKWIVSAITAYQRRGGGRQQFRVECNFEPGCSEYARQAIERFGIARGLGMAIKRISRCRHRDLVETVDDPVPVRLD